jgi:hypothetical protein
MGQSWKGPDVNPSLVFIIIIERDTAAMRSKTTLIIMCSAVWQPFTVRDIPSLYQRMASSEVSSQSRMLETTRRVGRRFMTTDRTGRVAQSAGVEQTDRKTWSMSVEVFEDRTVPGGAM